MRRLFIYILSFISFLMFNVVFSLAWGLNNQVGSTSTILINQEMKRVVLLKDRSFGSQLKSTDVVYVICYEFDLEGKYVKIPSNCLLEFEGGRIKNGVIENCGLIKNNRDRRIFSDVIFIQPTQQMVKLGWFDYLSVSEALENASKFGHVDCTGYWNLDKSVSITNDVTLENGNFKCIYGINNIKVGPAQLATINYNRVIKKGASRLPIKWNFGDAEVVQINSSDIYYKSEKNNRNGTRGELVELRKKTSNNVYLKTTTICEYKNNIRLTFFKPILVTISECRFYTDYNNNSDKGGTLVSICNAKAVVKNCFFTGCSIGLSLRDCINSNVISCTFERIFPWGLAFSGGTYNSSVSECFFDTNRHGWTTLGEQGVVKFCSIHNNVCKNSMLAICPHANAYGILIENNIVEGSQGGVGSFAPNSIIKNNKISKLNGFPAIYLTEAGGINPTVVGNQIENCKGYGGAIRNDAVDLEVDICYVPLQFCEIRDNTINNCPDFSGITCDYSKTGAVDVKITNNMLSDVGYTAILVKSSTAIIEKNSVNGVRRSNFTPILVHNPINKGKREAFIEGNTISRCNSENEIDVAGYDTVIFKSNSSDRKELKVKFENCRKIKRK